MQCLPCLWATSTDNADTPEIYRQRYRLLASNKPIPAPIIAVLAEVSPESAPVRSQAFVRPSKTHFLHATLTRRGDIDPAVYYFQTDDQGVVNRVLVCWGLKPGLEGPPTKCHGGCVAALLDDALGAFSHTHLKSLGRTGHSVTAFLHVDYKAPTPLSADVVCLVELDRIERRKVFVKGRMLAQAPDGRWVTTSEANALFVELKEGYGALKNSQLGADDKDKTKATDDIKVKTVGDSKNNTLTVEEAGA